MPGLLKLDWDGAPDFDIGDLLAVLPEDGERLSWRLFPMGESMSIIGDLTALGTTATELGERVNASESGISFPWDKLLLLAQNIEQTVWGTYVGCKDESAFASLAALYEDRWMYLDRVKPAYYETVEVAFQAVDSSFWLVYSLNDEVLSRIIATFEDQVTTLRSW